MSIVQISDLEIFLGITITSQSTEDKYTFLISSVQEAAESICYRKFDEQEYTEVYDGNGTDQLLLNQYPLFSVDSVKYGWWSDPRTEVLSTDYTTYDDMGIIAFGFNSLEKNQMFEVVYTAGYANNPSASNNIPEDLKQILMEQIASSFNKTFTDPGLKSEKLGDYKYERYDISTTSESNISSFAQKLNKYVRSDL